MRDSIDMQELGTPLSLVELKAKYELGQRFAPDVRKDFASDEEMKKEEARLRKARQDRKNRVPIPKEPRLKPSELLNKLKKVK